MTSRSNNQISGVSALLRDDRFWKIAFQLIVLTGVILAFLYLTGNLNANLSARGTQFGFSFLGNPAGFAVGESLIDYQPQDSYAKVLEAGIANSLRVMIIGVIGATAVGITAGVASFSDNWLLYKISRAYVGLVRNIPLLIQLFFWYLAVFFSFPGARTPFIFPSTVSTWLGTREIWNWEVWNWVVWNWAGARAVWNWLDRMLGLESFPGSNMSWFVFNNKGIYAPGPSFERETWLGIVLLITSLLLVGLFLRSFGVIRRGFNRSDFGSVLNFVTSLSVLPLILAAEFFLLFNWQDEKILYFKGAFLSLASSTQGLWVIVLVALIVPLFLLARWRTKAIVEQAQSGQMQLMAMAGLILFGLAVFLFLLGWQTPVAATNDEGAFTGGVTGGLRLSLEYSAIFTGLVFYTGAFIAEIVRAGVQSVSKGQWEAARSLGLSSGLAMRMVVFPQALRVIIPPLNSEFANLAKNSSLALAIGYPDLYSVANTTFNQTGRPVEVFLIMMAVYLVINLLISVNMNQLNNAVQFKER
ncbi:MAG: ABC transporter permease subunit [Cyanobacteria bacterium J06626_18]